MNSKTKKKRWFSKIPESFSNKEDDPHITWTPSPEHSPKPTTHKNQKPFKKWINTDNLFKKKSPISTNWISTASLNGKGFKNRSRKILEQCGINVQRSVSPVIANRSNEMRSPVLVNRKRRRARGREYLSPSPIIGLGGDLSRDSPSPVLGRKKLCEAIRNICDEIKGTTFSFYF